MGEYKTPKVAVLNAYTTDSMELQWQVKVRISGHKRLEHSFTYQAWMKMGLSFRIGSLMLLILV